MLKRKIQKKIEEWYQNQTNALLITGARQVGKSYIIRETLKQSHIDYVEFNFIDQVKLLSIFQSAKEGDSDLFLAQIQMASSKKLSKETVIFFDEIQECKDIVTIIKFLVEKGNYRYILSGSLLGVELRDLRSAPVGYLSVLDMYPLDLEEFYLANGLTEDIIEYLKRCYEKHEKVDTFIHDSLIDAFYKYLVIGGMPEAVQTYLNTNDYIKVNEVHKNIILLYKQDFTKYETEKKLRLIKTYDLIPAELNSKNKRYTFTKLDPSLHFDRYENSFNWLNDAGVSLPTYNVTEVEIPLLASKSSNLFKLFLSDVGLLNSIYGPGTISELLNHKPDINCGAIFENYVAQELNTHGFPLYYYNNKKHGEIDFLVEKDNKILPLEVKSGKYYKSHPALNYFISNQTFDKAYVLSTYNLEVDSEITYLPMYMSMFIKNDLEIQKIKQLDLSKLKL